MSETHRDRVGVLEPVHPNVPLGRHLAAVPLRARLVNDETIADCTQENRGRVIVDTDTEKGGHARLSQVGVRVLVREMLTN